METNKLNHETFYQNEIVLNVFDISSQKECSIIFMHSKHSLQRASQRGLSKDKIAFTIEYGECYFKQGLVYYVLGEKKLSNNKSMNEKNNPKNIVVVVDEDSNMVLTCYKSENAHKKIKRKSKSLYKNYHHAA
jgi:hypothetical protein